MSEHNFAGPGNSPVPPVGGDAEEKTQLVDRSAIAPAAPAVPDGVGEQTQVVPPVLPAPPWQSPPAPAAPGAYGQEVPPAAPQWQPPQPSYQPQTPQPPQQFGQPQFGQPSAPQAEQPWGPGPGGAPVPPPAPGFGGPQYGAPGFGAQVPPGGPGFGGFGPGDGQVPPPGFGGPQSSAYPGGPQYGQPGPQQTPVDMAKSLLTKGDSFIFRLMTRGVRGELIQQPWFQNIRNNPQGSNQWVYIGYGGAVLLGLFFSLFGGIGSVLELVAWLALAYFFLALGTKLSAQFVAYGICGVGAAVNLLGVLIGVIGIAAASSSPYVSGAMTGMLVVSIVISAVVAVVLGYIGFQVHKGIAKIAAGQF